MWPTQHPHRKFQRPIDFSTGAAWAKPRYLSYSASKEIGQKSRKNIWSGRRLGLYLGVMFTGLVETVGRVERFERKTSAYELDLEMPPPISGVQIGDSIAVNGCCLTVARISESVVSFDLLAESVKRTSFADLSEGHLVNLERSLLPTTRMGGHIVSGHVDEAGRIEVLEQRGADHFLQISCSEPNRIYLVEKGSIAVDGISLTVAELHENGFAVWLIPHTMGATNLQERRVGDRVNLEFDLLAKHVERMIAARFPAGSELEKDAK